MTNRIPDLKQVRASRGGSSSAPQQQPRPRLAERLVELAPLARAPLVTEDERPAPDDGLSRLSRPSYQPNALVPLRPAPVPRVREPDRLSPVGIASARPEPAEEGTKRDFTGFLIGLAIATAAGVALYALLT